MNIQPSSAAWNSRSHRWVPLSRAFRACSLLCIILAWAPACSQVKEYHTGRTQLEAGNHTAAVGSLTKALEGGDLYTYEFVEALRWRAIAYIRLERWKDALKDLDALLEEEPDNMQARYLRGLAHKHLGEHALAKQEFHAALNRYAAAQRRARLARPSQQGSGGPVLRRTGRIPADYARIAAATHMALGEIALYEDNYNQALQAFDDAVLTAPFLSEAYYKRAAALHYLENADEAQRDLEQFVALGGDEERDLTGASGPLLLKEALAHFNASRHADAELSASKALQRNPRYAPAALVRGLARAQQSKHRLAIQDFTQVLAQEPDNEKALLYRAFSLTEEEEYQRALADANAVLEHNATNPHGHLHRAYALMGLKQYDAAAGAFSIVLQDRPTHQGALFYRGVCHLKQNLTQDAIQDFNALLAQAPEDPKGHYFLGIAYQRNGQHAASIESLTRATRLDPQADYAADALYAVGMAHAALNQDADSAAALRKAIARSPSHRSAHLALSIVLSRIGNHAEAGALYEKARAMRPEAAKPQEQLLPEYTDEELRQVLSKSEPLIEKDLQSTPKE